MIWGFQENHETGQHGKTSGGLVKPFGNNKKSRNPGMHSWNAWRWVGNKHPGGVERKLQCEQRRALRKSRQPQTASQEGHTAGLSGTKTDLGVIRKSQGKIFLKSYKSW